MSPFRRLALFAASAAVVGGIAAVAHWLSAAVALEALVGGFMLALATTIEATPRGDRPARSVPAQPPATAIRARPRDEIAARAAVDDEDDDL